ncbi:CBS domain-containing protein [Polyangium aurulentum]|uniref:CBS domain-containing protein n=1 Tax=Polyangium aurulentum TaxID=2567896 RepID=UPI001F1C8BE1|nr:CBS domain-containing protein [Polyangium aurulentum]
MQAKKPTVADYMTRSPHAIGFDQPLSRAQELMSEQRIRHLPVLSGGRLVGLISERDVAFVEGLRELNPRPLRVDEAMTPIPYAVAPDTPLVKVAREMFQHRYGSAVVLEEGKVLGVFTTTDALRALADALDAKE